MPVCKLSLDVLFDYLSPRVDLQGRYRDTFGSHWRRTLKTRVQRVVWMQTPGLPDSGSWYVLLREKDEFVGFHADSPMYQEDFEDIEEFDRYYQAHLDDLDYVPPEDEDEDDWPPEPDSLECPPGCDCWYCVEGYMQDNPPDSGSYCP